MNGINIKNNTDFQNKLDLYKNKPYIIKEFSKNWQAQQKWSFNFLKKQDPNLIINTVIGNAATKEKNLKKLCFLNM